MEAEEPSQNTPIMGDLILRAEVSKQLNVCEHTLRDWERRGQGPPTIRIGKRVYYRTETVRRWLLEHEGRTPTT